MEIIKKITGKELGEIYAKIDREWIKNNFDSPALPYGYFGRVLKELGIEVTDTGLATYQFPNNHTRMDNIYSPQLDD